MNRLLSFLLCVAGFVILLQFWVFMVISEWMVDDSYAVMKFPEAHPVLGFFVELAWNIGTFGGRYALIFLMLVLFCWLIHYLRKRKTNDSRA